jgi:hyperosmotically inducible periplasmic protein
VSWPYLPRLFCLPDAGFNPLRAGSFFSIQWSIFMSIKSSNIFIFTALALALSACGDKTQASSTPRAAAAADAKPAPSANQPAIPYLLANNLEEQDEAAPARSSVTQDVLDARHETRINTTYALNPYLRNNDLGVTVRTGKATLTGTVDEDVNKELAGEIALGVDGITDVDNQIEVRADFVPVRKSTERNYGELTEDTTITAAIKSKLLWSRHAEGLDAEVETNMGRVTLKGTATSTEARDGAGALAMNTRGVVSVANQITIKAQEASTMENMESGAKEIGKDFSDAWITTRIKSTYLYSSNVDGSDISVDTANGIVTLTGKLASGAERDLAIELARNVRGVKKVQSKGLIL